MSRPASWWRSWRSRQGRVRSTVSATSLSVPSTSFAVGEINAYVCLFVQASASVSVCVLKKTVYFYEKRILSYKSLFVQKLQWERRFMPKVIQIPSMSSLSTSELIGARSPSQKLRQ